VASFTIAINLLLSLLLMGPLSHGGLALAVSISSIFQLAILLWKLRPKLEKLHWIELVAPLPKMMIAAIGMGLICWLIAAGTDWSASTPIYQKGLFLAASMVLGVIAYGVFLHILKVKEMHDFLSTFVQRLREGRS
jgi:putative peptidoglycan lipid II flippase